MLIIPINVYVDHIHHPTPIQQRDGDYEVYGGAKSEPGYEVDEFKAWLRWFDADQDGQISREELNDALHSARTWFAWWKARQGMKAADDNHDGRIDNSKEMEKLVSYA
ncbi:hypothetical protein SLEP1_g11903 [Rubroshorea leprosula]|nr:hypothetical protein SLEP1_g11903 [Rubroshorea leprosula]